MNRNMIIIVLLSLLFSCVALTPVPISQDKDKWSKFCFDGLGERVLELAGKDAMSCGIYGLNDSLYNFHRGLDCARKANGEGIPFTLGNVDYGVDSRYCKIVIKNSKAENYQMFFDFDVEGQNRVLNGVSALWEYSCEGIEIGHKNFEGSGCVLLNEAAKNTELKE